MTDRPVFALPAALVAQGYGVRPERDDDVAFLQRLYASTRARELAMMSWPEPQKNAFVLQQFGAQRHHYRTHFADSAFDVILHDDRPVGRLYLQRRAACYHVIDIALLPERCGQGLGTALFHALFAMARAEKVGVDLSVERFNPAQALYRRLGFVAVDVGDAYLAMEWRPAAPLS